MNPDLLRQVLVVVPSKEGTTFPGVFTFRSAMKHAGFAVTDFICVSHDDPNFEDIIGDFCGTTCICLGADAFYHLSGRKIVERKERGYVFLPEDFISREVKFYTQIGLYKTSNKKTGRQKGDPKYGYMTRTVSPYIPKNLKYVIPTITPRQVEESSKKLYPPFRADLVRALSFSVGEAVLLTPSQFITAPVPGEYLTLDIETMGYDGPVSHIAITTSGDEMSACSLPWNIHSKSLLQELIIASKCVQGHNLAFDIPRLEKEGITFYGKKRFDTMLCNILLFPDLLKGLERAATLYCNLRSWKYKSSFDMYEYNALDAFITHHIAKAQRVALSDTGMYDLFTKNIMPAAEVLSDMCEDGIKVDQKALGEWNRYLVERLKDSIKAWHSFTETDPFSSKKLIKFFYDDLHFKPKYAPRKKKAETLSVDKDAIGQLIEENPDFALMFRTLLDVRKWNKQLTTYANIEVSIDGRVHPSYLPYQKIAGTGGRKEDEDDHKGYASTGRPTSRDPDIQNQTIESKAIFIPSTPRHVFVEFDYSQIELRISAALSGDLALQKALEGDVHASTMDLLGCERVYAKAVTFGTMYGAGPLKLVRTLRQNGVKATKDRCADLQNAFSRAYPDLWAWRTGIPAEGIARHYLINPFERRRYFYAGSRQTTEMFNYLPQSTVADILIASLPVLAKMAKDFGGRIVATVHDSVLFEFLFSEIGEPLFQALHLTAEREWPNIAPGFFVPIKIKVGVPGGSWATVK